MNRNSSQIVNGLDTNDRTSNLPPPGGGLLMPSPNADDTANGNSSNSIQEDSSHALLACRNYPSDRLPNGDDSARTTSTCSSIAVGGARPKVKSLISSKHAVPSITKESSVDKNFPVATGNGYLQYIEVSNENYEEPPSYEAAMAMANGTYVPPNLGNTLAVSNGNANFSKGNSSPNHSITRNSIELDSIPNGNAVDGSVDNDEFSEGLPNDENNESDSDEDELNDEELTADLPKSFYALDVGSDSEGGNCTTQGVSRAGQSNLSTEVAKLLIQSEMAAQQQRLQNGQNRHRGSGIRPNTRRHAPHRRTAANRGQLSPSSEFNHQANFNGSVAEQIENEVVGNLNQNVNGDITPDEDVDFLEMDFEPNESDDSDDSGDSGRGADETTDGNDAADDLDEFVNDHGFGAPSSILGDYTHLNIPIHQSNHDHSEIEGAAAINIHDVHMPVPDFLGERNHLNINRENFQGQKKVETEGSLPLELPLAVTTTEKGTNHSACTVRPFHEHYAVQKKDDVSERTMQSRIVSEASKDLCCKVSFNNENNHGNTSAPPQSPAGGIDNNDELKNGPSEAHDMAMVRSRSLNSSLSSTLRRATNSLNSCIDSPCCLTKALAKASESDPGQTGGIGQVNNSKKLKKRHISDNDALLLGSELLAASPTVINQNSNEYPKVDMEVCGARLSQRETLVFGVPHNTSDNDHDTSVSNLTKPNSIPTESHAIHPNDAQIRLHLDPFQELSWISSALLVTEGQDNISGDNDSSEQNSPIDDSPQSFKIKERLTEGSTALSTERLHNTNMIDKIMIWNEVEACKRQINQVGVSACGATAVINVLQALEWPHDINDVISSVPTRLRANSSPIAEYLLSRSRAGTNHQDLIDTMKILTKDKVYGRFFHMYPQRNFRDKEENKSEEQTVGDLTQWLGKWISKG